MTQDSSPITTSKSSPLAMLQQHRRLFWGFIALICAVSMGYALYAEYVLGLEPCNLCMLQRGSMIALGTLAFTTFLLNPPRLGQIILGCLADLAALSGVILAGRHVWLQHLPEDKVPACGPPFDYLVAEFPIAQVIQEIFSGSGSCAEVKWQFLGFSMPELLLALFSFLFIAIQAFVVSSLVARKPSAIS